MTKNEALKLALEALESLVQPDNCEHGYWWEDCPNDECEKVKDMKAITAIKEALAQPDDLDVWKVRALQAEAVIEKFMAQPEQKPILVGNTFFPSKSELLTKFEKLKAQKNPVAKLQVTLEDRPIDIELAQYKQMLQAACADLGAINHALGLDPNDGGAESILFAIEELKGQPEQKPVRLECVVCRTVYTDGVPPQVQHI